MDPLLLLLAFVGGAFLLDKRKKKIVTEPNVVTIDGVKFVVTLYPEQRFVTRSDLGLEPYEYVGKLSPGQRVALVVSWDKGAEALVGRLVAEDRVQILDTFQGKSVKPTRQVFVSAGDQFAVSRRNFIRVYEEGVT